MSSIARNRFFSGNWKFHSKIVYVSQKYSRGKTKTAGRISVALLVPTSLLFIRYFPSFDCEGLIKFWFELALARCKCCAQNQPQASIKITLYKRVSSKSILCSRNQINFINAIKLRVTNKNSHIQRKKFQNS